MSSPSRATTAAASGSRQSRAGSETSTGALGPAQKTQSSKFVLADLLQCDFRGPSVFRVNLYEKAIVLPRAVAETTCSYAMPVVS